MGGATIYKEFQTQAEVIHYMDTQIALNNLEFELMLESIELYWDSQRKVYCLTMRFVK